jgi:hypothetical protein
MKTRYFLIPFLLLVMCAGVVSATGYFPSMGGNNQVTSNAQGTIPSNYTLDFSRGIIGGGYTESLVGDLDNDGTTETVAWSGNGTIAVFVGRDKALNSEVGIGDAQSNPVLCDLRNDGTRQVVALTNYNGTTKIVVLDYTSSNGLTITSTSTTEGMKPFGNMICSNFYAGHNDPTHYVFWVDDLKFLHTMSLSGSSIVDVSTNVNGAVLAEATSTYNFPAGSSSIIETDGFDTNGEKSIFFTAGTNLYKLASDGTSETTSIPFGFYSNTYEALRLVGGVNDGGQHTKVVVYQSGQLGNQNNSIAVFRETNTISGKTLSLQAISSTNGVVQSSGNNYPTMFAPSSQSLSLTNQNNGVTNIISVLQMPSTTNGFITTSPATFISTYNPANLSLRQDSEHATGVSGSGDFTYVGSALQRSFTINGQDVVYVQQRNGNIVRSTQQSNYTDELLLFNTSMIQEANGYSHITPVPADYNDFGVLGFVYVSNNNIEFFTTPNGASVGSGAPFNVTQLSSGGGGVVDKITVRGNGQNDQYRYTVACNIGTQNLIAQSFNHAFNFTNNTPYNTPVTTNVQNPGSYLTFNAWDVPYNVYSGGTSIQFYSPPNAGDYRGTVLFTMLFNVNDSTSNNLAFYQADTTITDDLELTRNGNVMTVEDVVPGQGRVSLGNASIGAGMMNLSIAYVPRTDPVSLQKYYDRRISFNNQTLSLLTTKAHLGTGFNNFQFADDIDGFFPNETKHFVLSSVNLQAGSFLYPDFITFTNGHTQDGETIPAPTTAVDGQGFTILTGVDNAFFSSCGYPRAGTYVQRHYISPLSVDDYTNYRDYQVTLNNDSIGAPLCVGGKDCINSVCTGNNCTYNPYTNNIPEPPAKTGDTVQDGLQNFLYSFGIVSTGIKMLFWFLISMFAAIIAFKLAKGSGIFGLLTFIVFFVAGVFIGFVPLWFIIILVILTAAAVAITYRYAVSGT